jgi:hypothetical protein
MPREKTRLILPLSQVGVGAIRLEIRPQPEVRDPTGGATRFKPASLSLTAAIRAPDGAEQPLKFSFADADHKTEHYAGGQLVLGVKDRWQLSPYHERQTAVWLLDAPVPPGKGTALILDLGGFAVASVRASMTPFPALEPLQSGNGHALTKVLAGKGGLGQPDRNLVQRTFLLATAAEPERVTKIRQLQAQVRECRGGRAFTMITLAREPLLTRVLRRGNWQDDGGDIVQPLVPHFLPQIPNPEMRRLNRLDLARWLVSPQNPLTARAVMNRLWKQFFGTGISAVVDDLGAQGEWPVHPELLDWLACEFRQPSALVDHDAAFPWDFKHMVRLIVLSSTYRQDSDQRPDLKEIDPNNRLLACRSPCRLEAEFVRDNALAIAGLLNPDIGGPSVFPYQPPGYYSYLQWPDRDYFPAPDDRQYRRGLYTHWQRAFLHPMLANFDAPSREECTANRIVSDTPQQALTLLNDPTFVEAARAFAARILKQSPNSDDQKLDAAFERALARPPRTNERASLLEFLAVQKEHYEQDQDGAGKLVRIGNAPAATNVKRVELAAWTQVCRVILNLHETITRY